MRFYKVRGLIKDIDFKLEQNDNHENTDDLLSNKGLINQIREKSEEFNDNLDQDVFLCMSRMVSRDFTLSIVIRDEIDLHALCKNYLKYLGLHVQKLSIKEVTFKTYHDMMRGADRRNFIYDEDDIYKRFDLLELTRYRSDHYEEDMIKTITKRDAIRKSHKLLSSYDIEKEIERIESNKSASAIKGHPVHYIIQVDDPESRATTSDLLLSILYKNKRIKSQRICIVDVEECSTTSSDSIDSTFNMCKDGTIIVSIQNNCDFDSDYINSIFETFECLCDNIKRHQNDVLIVFHLPPKCSQLKSSIFEKLGNLSFVEISEHPSDTKKSKSFLRQLAKDNNVNVDTSLYSKLEPSVTYLTSELRIIFEEWFSNKLRTEIYPQYSEFKMTKFNEVDKKPKGSAYEELMSMIGLDEPKRVLDQAINFHKMQKFLEAQDVTRKRPSMHMSFTGNPGTAKTTVARLFARIMRENELLSSGHIIEVGRGDLVGKYVGHTAPNVKKCFEKAKGGVLFIDEAYSLLDDREGMYGDEAINTIVQEMENNRDNIVVIFAGYPDKMNHFLKRNPGLRSRIAFHVPFTDYTQEQLYKIAELVASNKDMRLSEGTNDRLMKIFKIACKEDDFGNGRFVRSTIEKAMMAQATRLVNSGIDSLTKTELNTLLPEDFEIPAKHNQERINIGFCA